MPSGSSGAGRGNGGLKVIASASGRFRARGNEAKLAEVSPNPGRNRMTLVGVLFGGRWIVGLREVGKSLALGVVGGMVKRSDSKIS